MILNLILILGQFSSVAAETDLLSTTILKDMTLTYSQVEYMKTQYEKEQTSELLGEMESSTGTLEFSKGRLRVEEKNSENRNIFIKNKKTFWHLQPDNQVLMGPVSKAVPSIFEMMFSDPKVWDDLDSRILKRDDNIAKIKISMGKDRLNYSNFVVTINTKKRRFETISFEDEIGNATNITFKNTSFFRKAKNKRFEYKPNKKDKVNSI